MRRIAVLSLLIAGCNSVGPADTDAALEVVYDHSGTPLFAGQALAIASCGGGAYCHSEGIDVAERRGAPQGLDFDVRIASTTAEVEEAEADRLLRHQRIVLGNRGLLWEQVGGQRMPPGGTVGDDYRRAIDTLFYRGEDDVFEGEPLVFDRFDDAGEPRGPLPGLDTEEGREIFRNWLASGVPVVERTQGRIDRQPNVTGYTMPTCERTCVDPTWESIYVQIIRPSCALASCHAGEEPASDRSFHVELGDLGDLTIEELGALVAPLRDALVGDVANESECALGGHELIVPGDPETSVLYRKVEPARTTTTTTSCTRETVDEDCGGLTAPECIYVGEWSCEGESASLSGTCMFTCEVCGAEMPASGNPLTEQRLCAIREWIACGACAAGDGSCDACIETARGSCGVGAPFDPATGTAACAVQQPCPNRPR